LLFRNNGFAFPYELLDIIPVYVYKELGVSHSYLSRVLHGKRPASEKVNEALNMVSMVSKSQAKIGTSTPSGGIRLSLVGSIPMRPRQLSCLTFYILLILF